MRDVQYGSKVDCYGEIIFYARVSRLRISRNTNHRQISLPYQTKAAISEGLCEMEPEKVFEVKLRNRID